MFCGTIVVEDCFGDNFFFLSLCLVGLKGLKMLPSSSWSNCAVVSN